MTTKPRRVALYLRVSTDGQTTALQRRDLVKACEHRGWEVTEVYEDAGISGAKGREGRPAFDRLCQDATRRRFDVIAAWSVDRLGRSLQDLVGFWAKPMAQASTSISTSRRSTRPRRRAEPCFR